MPVLLSSCFSWYCSFVVGDGRGVVGGGGLGVADVSLDLGD